MFYNKAKIYCDSLILDWFSLEKIYKSKINQEMSNNKKTYFLFENSIIVC